MMKRKRGIPIGSYTSQPIGNFITSFIDHFMKEKVGMKCYLRYCDDVVGLARNKNEAKKQLMEYIGLSDKVGLIVKADAFISPVGKEVKRAKHRKRMRSHKRKTS